MRVLVATDRTRGIHVDDIALVVHADRRRRSRSCTARATACAGASGIVVTLCQREQNKKVRRSWPQPACTTRAVRSWNRAVH